jgi:hypothetical protein
MGTAGPSSDSAARNQPTQVIDGFALTGVSNLPDPATHAYRKDLADTALAGRVIASHYAEPLVRHLVRDSRVMAAPSDDAEEIARLRSGDELRILDSSRGWAWGYLPDGRVGYVRAEAVAA